MSEIFGKHFESLKISHNYTIFSTFTTVIYHNIGHDGNTPYMKSLYGIFEFRHLLSGGLSISLSFNHVIFSALSLEVHHHIGNTPWVKSLEDKF